MLEGDEAVGASIIYNAIEAPLRQLVENAGEEGAVIGKMLKIVNKVAVIMCYFENTLAEGALN